MKKYFELSLSEAIKYFIEHSSELIPGSYDEGVKVSVTMPVHPFSASHKENDILLKKLVSEVEKRLNEKNIDRRETAKIMENIKEAKTSMDHGNNMKSLVLYANRDFASIVKLPIELKAETVIGDYFDTRPVYKAKQQIENYYIVVITQHKIRLIHAVNDTLVQEFEDEDFPFLNTQYFTTEWEELGQASFTDNLIREYFKMADKRLHNYIALNHFPVILAGDVKSVSYFREMMDDDRLVINHLNGNFDHCSAPEIVREAYPLVEVYMHDKIKNYVSNIENVQSARLASYDLNEIYRSVSSGNVNKLYMANNLSLKGKVVNDRLVIDAQDANNPDSQELTINIIKKTEESKGNIIFVDDELLEEYKGIVLVRRYE